MAATEFKFFPFLPKEIRDEIWIYVVFNTQERLFKDTGRAMFFTIYDADYYGPKSKMPEEYREGRLVEEEEKVGVDLKRMNHRNRGNCHLAAPRPGPWLPSTWDAMDALESELEWNCCREARKHANKLVENINCMPDGTRLEGEGVEYMVPDAGLDFEEAYKKLEQVMEEIDELSDSEGHMELCRDCQSYKFKRIQTIVRYTSNGEARMVPITLARDLMVIQPLDMQATDAGAAFVAIQEFETHNVALEFDPSWGYIAGANASRFVAKEDGAYGPLALWQMPESRWSRWDPDSWVDLPNRKGGLADIRPPLDFVSMIADKEVGTLWLIDHRLRLRDGALIDEGHSDFPRHVFRDSRYLYVEVNETDKDWEYSVPDGGVLVHKFAEQLYNLHKRDNEDDENDEDEDDETEIGELEYKVGVLARIPLEDVERLEAEVDGIPASSSARFTGRVESPLTALEESIARLRTKEASED